MSNDSFQSLRKERGYTYEDEIIVSRQSLTDYDQKVWKLDSYAIWYNVTLNDCSLI